MSLKLRQQMLVNNDCYKLGVNIKPKGIIVHSTGADNPRLSRYIQPDDGLLGDNKYNNDWNQPNVSKCVHAFIGKDKNGDVWTYQTLPWNMRGWHSGSGSKGYNANANNTGYIGFEMCEDDLTDREYLNEVYTQAVELCAFLCKEYDIPVNRVIGHYEGWQEGICSNHGDPRNWFNKHGKSMSGFRKDVERMIKEADKPKEQPKPEQPKDNDPLYRVRKSWSDSKSQLGAYKILQNAKDMVNDNPTYKVFDEQGKVVYEVKKEQPKPKEIKVGSTVTVKKTADKYQTGENIASFVKGSKYKVLQIKSVNQGKSKKAYLLDGIVSWVLEEDLQEGVVNSPTPSKPNQPSTSKLKVGSKVRIKQSAKYYAGSKISIPSWVKNNQYTIQQLKSDRALLKEIVSWVKLTDLQ